MNSLPTWGVVATVKAPARDTLNFAAYHLELGAHRVHVYLDADNPQARAALKAHPKCRVTVTDDAYWQRRGKDRPEMHQPRQTANATHCYTRGPGVDWLAHIDVDEFLWPAHPLPEQLAALPPDMRSARVHPVEALAPDPDDPPPGGVTWCKGHARHQGPRRTQTNAIYPTFGEHLNGGFLSHVAGKVFVRAGLDKVSLRIHNAFFDRVQDPAPARLDATRLVHLHAHSWEHWLETFRFRMARGSYRAGLRAAPMPDGIALTMNQLFAMLEHEGGEEALAAFYREVCTATPELRRRLDAYGHLHAVRLDLDAKRRKHFGDAA
ncbi:glycosyltransferase family 2 protein [Roseovarius salis]|uniref:glycosyltransferase family 2 protein n=1 Tax=Roseovarius salis TaxID=3376063 RepID=UPI0037CA84A1